MLVIQIDTDKDIPTYPKDDAWRQVNAYGYVGCVTDVENCN